MQSCATTAIFCCSTGVGTGGAGPRAARRVPAAPTGTAPAAPAAAAAAAEARAAHLVADRRLLALERRQRQHVGHEPGLLDADAPEHERVHLALVDALALATGVAQLRRQKVVDVFELLLAHVAVADVAEALRAHLEELLAERVRPREQHAEGARRREVGVLLLVVVVPATVVLLLVVLLRVPLVVLLRRLVAHAAP